MIGNHIEDVSHPGVVQCLNPTREIFFTPNFGIDPVVIDDVISVRAAGAGFEIRRCVTVSYSQFAQIIDDRRRIAKGKTRMKLKSIGRLRK